MIKFFFITKMPRTNTCLSSDEFVKDDVCALVAYLLVELFIFNLIFFISLCCPFYPVCTLSTIYCDSNMGPVAKRLSDINIGLGLYRMPFSMCYIAFTLCHSTKRYSQLYSNMHTRYKPQN